MLQLYYKQRKVLAIFGRIGYDISTEESTDVQSCLRGQREVRPKGQAGAEGEGAVKK